MRSKAASHGTASGTRRGSVWLTEYGLPVTTVSAMMGHANPSFTLACYGRDPRDTETMVADVLARAAAAGYLTKPAYRSRRRESERQTLKRKAPISGAFR